MNQAKELRGALLGLLVGYAIAVFLAMVVSGSPSTVLLKAISVLFDPYSLQINMSSVRYLLSLWGPVGLAALGLTLCFRARFITIAAEGQILIGMLITIWLLAYVVSDLSPLLGIAVAILASAFAGATLGTIPALLRAYFGANEILVALMVNLTVTILVSEIVSTHLRIGAHVITKSIPDHFRLSELSVLVFLISALALVWFIESRTSLGLIVKVFGSSRRTALTYGVNEAKLFLKLGVLAGALAGLGGALAALSFQHFLSAKLPIGFGYSGVLSAWLSGFSPPIALASSLLLSYIRLWAYAMMVEGVPEGFVLGSQTIIVVSALAGAYAMRSLNKEVKALV
ncbi:MAG: hypothetical protein QXN05_04615 [Acidilobaceae archaeon]